MKVHVSPRSLHRIKRSIFLVRRVSLSTDKVQNNEGLDIKPFGHVYIPDCHYEGRGKLSDRMVVLYRIKQIKDDRGKKKHTQNGIV